VEACAVSRGFELVPLDCPACGAPLAAEATDVVFYCTACHSGFRYEPAAPRDLAPVEVAFVASPHRAAEGYAPFWLLPAKIEILGRDATGGLLSGLLGFFSGESAGGAPGEGTFAVPAFALPIADAVVLTLRYTQELPRLDTLLGERLTGGICDVGDAEKLAEYALVASEVRKQDTLRNLEYRLSFAAPRLLGVPWVRAGAGRADAVFGQPMGGAPGAA
jgi:hypothetical protein